MESIRRAQLIMPFGVGSLHTLKGGVTVITAGLDHWFVRSNDAHYPVLKEEQWDEYRITKDKRFIRERLGVDFLMTPPEYKIARQGAGTQVSHPYLSVPAFRFPQWHICERCSFMNEVGLTHMGRVDCPYCQRDNVPRARMIQTRFITICPSGHAMDFPWREWVMGKQTDALTPEESAYPLHYSGGASSREIVVTAYSHDRQQKIKSRTLGSAFGTPNQKTGETPLSRNLTPVPEDLFVCKGQRPWLMEGRRDGCGCGMSIATTLINASNAYFSEVASSLFIPPPQLQSQPALRELYEKVHELGVVSSDIAMLKELLDDDLESVAKAAHKKHGERLQCSHESLLRVLQMDQSPKDEQPTEISAVEQSETEYRAREYSVLINPTNIEELKTRRSEGTFSNSVFDELISNVILVDRLMETRALTGFSRLEPDTSEDLSKKRMLLRRNEPENGGNWLPAIEVYGEGIFIDLNSEMLAEWETRSEVETRARSLQYQYDSLGRRRKEISARFILIHTLSHLLISQIAYECGYSSSSLRERLYVSNDSEAPMSGVLIYTADGDSDGTLGGLVRLGAKSRFERILNKALKKAQWCSSDPICSETEFQGQHNCNKAACHNCCVISETCCEEMNRFLDRGLVVGTVTNRNLGFFQIA